MIKKFSFEITVIIAVLFILIFVVGGTGWLAYRSFSAIIDSASKTGPNEKLLILKEITSSLSAAGNSMHFYTLVKEQKYIDPFYASLNAVDEKMNRLYELAGNDREEINTLDSMSGLVAAKYTILRKFLTLHNEQHIVEGLESIAEKLNVLSVADTARTQPGAVPEKKNNLFRKIFGGKDKSAVPNSKLSTPKSEKMMELKEVRGTLLKVKQDQFKKLQETKEQELQYAKEDQKVSDELHSLSGRLEKKQVDTIAGKNKENEKKLRETNRLIALFCAVASALLIFMGIVIVRYVSKNRTYSKTLKKAKTDAENLAMAKENFLAATSHEIRTPLNAISGFTDQLLQASPGEEQKKSLEIIKKASDHLLEIINELLDYSKLRAGKIQLQPVVFSPAETVKEVIQLLTPLAENKKLGLHSDTKGSIPDRVIGDEFRLKQVLLNLAGNAVKFTEKGSIKIQVSTLFTEHDQTRLSIKIKDTGIGIGADELKKIFNEFEQAGGNISKKFGGTGLGLSISKKLVELQGGKIDIASEPGRGTEVTVTIPYLVYHGKKTSSPPPDDKIEQGLLKNRSVLIVDDEEYNRMLLTMILKKWGVRFSEAGSGTEALNKLQEKNYDAVLMDVRMEGSDGIETTRHIREKIKSKIPVIALTAAASETDMQRCKNAGFNDFLSKPFKEKELYVKMLRLLDGKKLPVEKPENSSAGTKNNFAGNFKKYSLVELKRIAGEDEKFFREMLSTFITSTEEGVNEIIRYTRAGDWDKVGHYAHKIASPCRHLHADGLLELLLVIEWKAFEKKEIESIPRLVKKLEEEKNELLSQLKTELEKPN